MSLICLVSAKGAPGTTTTALLLAALWPRDCVLVDADPMGGDIGLRLPSESGAPLRTDAGLLRLLPAARRGLSPDVVLGHCQEAQGGQLVITGLEGPEQASAVSSLWDELGQSFAGMPDHDVFADAGQAHTNVSTLPMLRRAAAVVFVVQPTVTSVVHTRQRVAALLPELTGPDGRAPLLGFVVAEASKTRSSDTETTAVEVQSALESLRFFGAIAHDSASVRMFEGSPQRHPERSLLVRSGSTVVSAIADALDVQPAVPDGPLTETEPANAGPSAAPPSRSLAELWLADEAPETVEVQPTTRRESRARRWPRKGSKS